MNETPKKKNDEKEGAQGGKPVRTDEGSSALGVWIPIGMLFGVAIGGFDEDIGLAVGIALGMLGGVVVGLLVDSRNGRHTSDE